MVSAGNGTKSSRSHGNGADRGGFCGAIQRAPPIMPPSLARRLSNKENMGFGRVSMIQIKQLKIKYYGKTLKCILDFN
jgi:hypothetical protein